MWKTEHKFDENFFVIATHTYIGYEPNWHGLPPQPPSFNRCYKPIAVVSDGARAKYTLTVVDTEVCRAVGDSKYHGNRRELL